VIIPEYAVEPLGFAGPREAVGQTVTVGVLGLDGQVRDLQASVSGVQVKSLIGGNIPFGNQAFGDRLEELSSAGGDPAAATWHSSVLVSSADVPRVVEDLSGAGFAVSTAEQTVGDYKSIVNGVLLLLNVLASVAILAAMFGIVNTLLMSVQERTRQIGMFRALGMSRLRIFQSISLEAGLLGLVGAVLAVALGVAAGTLAGPGILASVDLELPGLELFRFDPASLAVIVLAVVAAALVAAVLPAVRAARLEPMDALRDVR
jgi:putative ABC transport system permease protein